MAPKPKVETNGHGAGVKLKTPAPEALVEIGKPTPGGGMQRFLDPALLADPLAAVTFIGNVLEASTEYSIIGEDLDGNIQHWNEGARRLYGYEPEDVIGKANSSILHTAEDVIVGL